MPPFEIDPAEFESMLEQRVNVDRELKNYVGILLRPILSLSYEELLLDECAFFTRIFAFLEISPLKLEGRTFKNTPDDLSKSVINFSERRSSYIGTIYESMFDEILVPTKSR